jgi:hypothetical protein
MPDSPVSKAARPFNFVGRMQDGMYYFHIDQLMFICVGLITVGLCYNQKKMSRMRPTTEGNPQFSDWIKLKAAWMARIALGD